MKPPTPPEIVAAIVADYASGMSSPEVARKHGVSAGTALRYATKAGINRTPTIAKSCSVEECPNPHHSGGYCRKHLHRFKRHGDPLAGNAPREGGTKFGERLEDLRFMAEMGENIEGAAERLGMNVSAVERFLRRHDNDTLTALIARRPRDHNRHVMGEAISVSELTGLTDRLKSRKQRQEVAA